MPITEEEWEEGESIPGPVEETRHFLERKYPEAYTLDEIVDEIFESPEEETVGDINPELKEGVKEYVSDHIEILVHNNEVERKEVGEEAKCYYRVKNNWVG